MAIQKAIYYSISLGRRFLLCPFSPIRLGEIKSSNWAPQSLSMSSPTPLLKRHRFLLKLWTEMSQMKWVLQMIWFCQKSSNSPGWTLSNWQRRLTLQLKWKAIFPKDSNTQADSGTCMHTCVCVNSVQIWRNKTHGCFSQRHDKQAECVPCISQEMLWMPYYMTQQLTFI